jgi:hypothetical protein
MAENLDASNILPPADSGAPSTGDYQAGLDFINKQQQGLGKRSDELYRKLQSDTEAGNKALTDATAAYRKTAEKTPDYAKVPDAPDLEVKKMSLGAGVAAFAAGLLVGKLAHTNPFMTAVDATNKTFKAQADGDKEARAAALKQWQTSIGAMKEHNAQMKDVYDQAVELAKTDITGAQQLLKNGISAYASGMSQIGAQQKSLQDLFKTYDAAHKSFEHAADRNQRAVDAAARHDASTAKKDDKFDTTATEYIKDMLGLDKVPHMNEKDAGQLRDTIQTAQILDRLDRSIAEKPDVARKVSQYAQQAHGNMDSFLKIAQDSGDADTALFAKSMIDLTRAGAMKLAGARGITVTGERIANKILQDAVTPQGIKLVARQFANDLKGGYTSLPGGQRIDWGKVPRLSTLSSEAVDTSPVVGRKSTTKDKVEAYAKAHFGGDYAKAKAAVEGEGFEVQ